MPDANTVWTFAFGLIAALFTGLAFWSYHHRRTYWKVQFIICTVSWLITSGMLVANITINLIVSDLLAARVDDKGHVISKAFQDHSWPDFYIALFVLVSLVATALSMVPHKGDDNRDR